MIPDNFDLTITQEDWDASLEALLKKAYTGEHREDLRNYYALDPRDCLEIDFLCRNCVIGYCAAKKFQTDEVSQVDVLYLEGNTYRSEDSEYVIRHFDDKLKKEPELPTLSLPMTLSFRKVVL